MIRKAGTEFRVADYLDTAEVYLYCPVGSDYIDGISARQFADELNALKHVSEITLRINSEGGSVFEGHTIYNLLKQHPAKIHVMIDGLAASIASVIAMAGDSIQIAENGFVMVHQPWSIFAGTADDFRQQAALLDKVGESIVATYAARTGQATNKLVAMMHAETWLDSAEALRLGFVDSVTADQAVAACVRPELFKYRHTPATLSVRTHEPHGVSDVDELQEKINARWARYEAQDKADEQAASEIEEQLAARQLADLKHYFATHATAKHESGHAAAVLASGGRVLSISATGGDGECYHDQTLNSVQRAIVHLAGSVAEGVPFSAAVCSGDRANLIATMRAAVLDNHLASGSFALPPDLSDEELIACGKHFYADAEEICDRQGYFVAKLAGVLAHAGRLSGDQVDELWNEYRMR